MKTKIYNLNIKKRGLNAVIYRIDRSFCKVKNILQSILENSDHDVFWTIQHDGIEIKRGTYIL